LFSILMVSWVMRLADGWGPKTTELPPLIMLMALLIMVAAGLVDGVTEAITPQDFQSLAPEYPVRSEFEVK
jgi:hypothetical protein